MSASSTAAERAAAWGYLAAWRAVGRLPERRTLSLFERLAERAYRRDGRGVQMLRGNLAVVRPDVDPAELESLVRAGMRSYLRYWAEAFRLPRWPTHDLVARTTTVEESRLRGPHAQGRGVISVLPHQGNWDWAGAWACATGMPVLTVAERLRPERLYDEFVAFREGLGMRILPLTGGADPTPLLEERLRDGGFVCLLADRHLGGAAAEVDLCGRRVRLPVGAALLAQRTGAALVPTTTAYDGPRLRITFHAEVEPTDPLLTMQAVADAFTEALQRDPADWHMMQRVFEGVEPRPGPSAGAAMKVGLVCPYSLDVAGGVQHQVLELAETLRARGVDARVLAPGRRRHGSGHVTTTGQDAPLRWNGAVARVHWGPSAGRATRDWLSQGFDLLHVHEPVTPSVTWHAVLGATCPVVGTAHTAQQGTTVLRLGAATASREVRARIGAWTAVSPDAARTLSDYCHLRPTLVPNGLHVEDFDHQRTPYDGGPVRILFLGRVEEPRKGLEVALGAFDAVADRHEDVVLEVAGPGDLDRVRRRVRPRPAASVLARITGLGPVDLPAKAELLGRADVVLAPQLGGESFGIVVAEAMAAGAAVLASDLPAFSRLLGDGSHGVLVPRGDVPAWATGLEALVLDPARRAALGSSAREAVDHLDWKRVSDDLLAVYATALG